MKCVDCPDYKACRRQNDLRRKRHKCKKANEPFVQTNADRIRAMSDEELAASCLFPCPYISDPYDECKFGWHTPEQTCAECILEWLKQPVKDGDNT